MKLNLERDSKQPLYRQITVQIKEYIRSGVLPPGSRLPTIRRLAGELRLTRLTVQTAYGELQAEGLIETVVGRGTFVAPRSLLQVAELPGATTTVASQPPWASQGLLADMLRLNEQPDLISFAQAVPASETIPLEEIARSYKRALKDSTVLGYGTVQGDPALREQAAYLLLDRGIVTSPEQLMVISGAQQGLDLCLKALTRPGEVLLVDEPAYPGLLELAQQRQLRLVGIPFGQDGPDLTVLEAACRRYRPGLFYTVPTFHNPTGFSSRAGQRLELLKLAETYRLKIIEDDVYGLLHYDAPAPAALKANDRAGQVIYIMSFSKCLCPGLRLGVMAAGPDDLPSLLAAKRVNDLSCSALAQRSLADFLSRRHLPVHLVQARRLYQTRRDSLLAALEQDPAGCEWSRPAGGLTVWVKLPAEINERDFYLEAIEKGVGIAPGSAFFIHPPRQPYMRLSFSAHPSDKIAQGTAILQKLIKEHCARHRSLLTRAGREAGLLV